MDATDQECVERCRNGEPDDFRFLVERYQKPLFAYLAGRLRDRSLAEEATQESFVRAFFALRRLQKPGSFHAWLLGIGGRVAHEFQRRASRQVATDPAWEFADHEVAADREDDHLEEAIAALPESYQQVILLRFYEELSCQQVADRLNLPLGTVTKTLSRAYAELRQHLRSSVDPEAAVHSEIKP
jgi:RNA polymerase sigma-70 factor (ECF subfamily)